ncbi:hypothetical protein Lupro_10120 [Lutibacter profundi]|uniref:Uncharacterized protein n=1 Tax=Lutibacter profundi TaxID=1622118 RepID=A0A0X8G7S7_9FLAO|nr:efflux RND transporter periplasmic adaptor subunit [Lutibacter profundi]AMC11598.1 hypothetical protein Lupro_10120 [Lutibacter profundi]
MKNIITFLIISILLISCKSESKKGSLEELTNQKTVLTGKIESLSKELKTVEEQISKLDNRENLQIITVIPVKNDTFKHYVEIQGIVQADKNIEIRPELGGIVKTIFVKEGQRVTGGQTLIQLEDVELQDAITELNTQLFLAKTTFERQKRLWDQKIGSEIQYLQTKTKKESLENKLASLKTQAKKMKITAPFSGVVDEIFPKKGELTSPQLVIIRLLNLDNIYVEADVTETYLPIIKIGTETIISFPSIHKEVTAKITQVGNYINPNNRSFKTRINLPNKNQRIKPNLLADVKFLDFKANGIIVPSNLVQQDQNNNNYVFTVKTKNGEHTVVKSIITAAKEYNHKTYVSEGLTKNDTIVNKGARLVQAGEIVKISAN